MTHKTYHVAVRWRAGNLLARPVSRQRRLAEAALWGRVLRLLVASLAVWLSGVSASTGFDGTECERVLRESIQSRAFPGCTAVVGTEDKLLWSAALGHHDYSGTNPVTLDAIYDLASLTKVAGTTAVFMRLVALDKARLDDPIIRFVPEFLGEVSEPEQRAQRERVTIEHLLTHSAGLGPWKPFYRSVNSYAELLAEVFRIPLEAPPGERHRYSDISLILAGEVAARAGGQPLPRLERELIFEPLGMTHTLRCPPLELLSRIPPTEIDAATGQAVHGVVHDENARGGNGETGHAGLFATAEDLGKLAAELLRGAEGRSELFPRDVLDQFFRPRSVGGTVRAVGWNVLSDDEGLTLNHTGFTGTSLQLDLQRKRYAVLLTNRVHPSRDNQQIARVRKEFRTAVKRQFAGESTAEP